MLKLLCRVEIWVVVFAGLCLAQFCLAQEKAPGRTPKGVYPTSHGVLKSIAGSQLLVQVDDEHEMKFRITHKTKIFTQDKQGTREIKASSLQAGQTVDVDMQTSLDGVFEAVRVTVVSPKVESPKVESPK